MTMTIGMPRGEKKLALLSATPLLFPVGISAMHARFILLRYFIPQNNDIHRLI